jgi:subtilase-type serine protease
MRRIDWVAGLVLAAAVMGGTPALAMDGIGYGGSGGSGGSTGGGWIHPTQGASGASQARWLAESLLQRLRDGGGGTSIWGAMFGGRATFHPDGADIKDDEQAGVVGGDIAVGDWRLGLAGGVTKEDTGADSVVGSAKADGWMFGVYGGGQLGPLDLRLGADQSRSSVTTRRLDGAVTLTADYDVDTTQLFGELAVPLKRGGWTFEPFVTAGWTRLQGDQITETGGAGAVTGSGLNFATGYSDVGVRFGWNGLGDFTPRFSVAWRQGFGDQTPTQVLDNGVSPPPPPPPLGPAGMTTTTKFGALAASATAGPVSGPALPDSSAVVRAGFGLQLGPAARLNVGYDASFSDQLEEQALRLQLSYSF